MDEKSSSYFSIYSKDSLLYIKNNPKEYCLQINFLDLTLSISEEKENFESANIYIFEKNNDEYNLLLKSDKVNLEDNKLVFNDNKILNINGNNISLIDENDNMYSYGLLGNRELESNAKLYINNNEITNVVLNSEIISNTLIDFNDYERLEFSKVKYKLLEDGEFNEYFKDTETKENLEIEKDNLNISINDNNESEYYVLIEMFDIYNDSYYSKIERIN